MNKPALSAYTLIIAFWLSAAIPVWAQTENPLLYELLERIELLEREVRQLRGELEILQYQRQQSPPSATTSTPSSLPPVAPAPGTVPPSTVSPTPAPLVPPAPAASPPDGAEQGSYDTAFNHLRDGQYEQAITGFEDFLRRYPGSTLTPDAYYWLGESYYVTRRFEQARQMFLTLGADYPRSPKLPDAMLKLGYIYSETGDTAKAREMLQKLIEVYPDSVAASLGEAHLRSLP